MNQKLGTSNFIDRLAGHFSQATGKTIETKSELGKPVKEGDVSCPSTCAVLTFEFGFYEPQSGWKKLLGHHWNLVATVQVENNRHYAFDELSGAYLNISLLNDKNKPIANGRFDYTDNWPHDEIFERFKAALDAVPV